MSSDMKNAITGLVEGMMTPERCISIFWHCCQKTPQLQQCAPVTLIAALKNLLMMRCEPDGIHGYLVPFWVNDKSSGQSILTCAAIPSARGLMRMARSNGVTNLNIGIVRNGEPFSWRLDDGRFTMSHVPGWDDTKDPIRGFYCTWTDKDRYLHGERLPPTARNRPPSDMAATIRLRGIFTSGIRTTWALSIWSERRMAPCASCRIPNTPRRLLHPSSSSKWIIAASTSSRPPMCRT